MRRIGIGTAVLLVTLAGCGPRPGAEVVETAAVATPTPPPTRTAVPDQNEASSGTSFLRTDTQGAVVVEITPVDLRTSGDSLDFSVSLNTHSIDLSMDLAAASTLATDTGLSVSALGWLAPRGGHHVSGELVFPASVDGVRLLEGVSMLTLTITGLDAPERTFTWDLNS